MSSALFRPPCWPIEQWAYQLPSKHRSARVGCIGVYVEDVVLGSGKECEFWRQNLAGFWSVSCFIIPEMQALLKNVAYIIIGFISAMAMGLSTLHFLYHISAFSPLRSLPYITLSYDLWSCTLINIALIFVFIAMHSLLKHIGRRWELHRQLYLVASGVALEVRHPFHSQIDK